MNKPSTTTVTFGEHLMIDGYRGSHEKLISKQLVERCLSELPIRLAMKPLCGVQTYWAEPNHIKDPGGWSGYILIAESHISIHTFPGRRFISADVYTCRSGLDKDDIVQYFVDAFELEDTEINFVKRGSKYPGIDIE